MFLEYISICKQVAKAYYKGNYLLFKISTFVLNLEKLRTN